MTRPGVWWNERSERAGVSGSRPSAVRAPPPTPRPRGLRPRRLLFPPKPLYDDTSHGAPGKTPINVPNIGSTCQRIDSPAPPYRCRPSGISTVVKATKIQQVTRKRQAKPARSTTVRLESIRLRTRRPTRQERTASERQDLPALDVPAKNTLSKPSGSDQARMGRKRHCQW